MSLKGADDYQNLIERYSDIQSSQQTPETKEFSRTVADILGLEPEVIRLKAKASRWRRAFISLAVVFVITVGGLGFTCLRFYASENTLNAEWENGFAQGKSEGYALGYDEGFIAGTSEFFAFHQGVTQGENPAEEQEVQVVEPIPETSTESSDSSEITVYITDTGEKYHRDGCNSLWNSQIERTLTEALSQGYTPCKRCSPPTQ